MIKVYQLTDEYNGNVTTELFYDKDLAEKRLGELENGYDSQDEMEVQLKNENFKSWNGGEVIVSIDTIIPTGTIQPGSTQFELYVLTEDYLGKWNTRLFTELELARSAFEEAVKDINENEPDELSDTYATWNSGEILIEINSHVPEGELYVRSYYTTCVELENLGIATTQYGSAKEMVEAINELIEHYGGPDNVERQDENQIVFVNPMVNIVFGNTLLKV